MDFRVEIVPVKFARSGRTINTIHVYFEGGFIGSANQPRAAANMLTDRNVPLADALAAIDRARATYKEKGS
ncbi:hypothetical protein [Rhizobium sp. IBUN]|uniref:hypothetical protein n=1 Tax=Rhizobium sp. IBUN TaxID=1042326 RepID=UPI00040FE778|nr:hypothetical protein [Rhizobium sp. IBUN]